MERVPNGRYTKEFREEAVKMAMDGGLSVLEISRRLSLPKIKTDLMFQDYPRFVGLSSVSAENSRGEIPHPLGKKVPPSLEYTHLFQTLSS